MTTDVWIASGAGNWTTTTDWGTGSVPGRPSADFITTADSSGNLLVEVPVGTTNTSDAIAMSVVINGAAGQGRPVQGGQSFSEFIGFGDSNTDSGYYFTHPISNNSTLEAQYQAAVAAGGGVPTSLGGVMNSVLLAEDFGVSAIPVGEPGGTNYAASSATVGTPLSGSLAPSIPSQIQAYLASNGNHADPNAIYLLSGGGNDTTVAKTMSGAAAQDAYMIQQANTLAQSIEQLYAAGARYIVDSNGLGTGNLAKIFADTLWSDLAAAGIPIIPAQTAQYVVPTVDANPAAFGITNTTQPPAGPFGASNPYNSANGGADIDPNPSLISAGWARYATQLVSPNAGQTYLWADDEHLSAAGQQVDANYVYSLVQNDVPTVSETLTASVDLVGNSTTQLSYQWQSLAPGQATWSNIAGATSSTFVVQAADQGLQLRVETTYMDSTAQTSTAFSPATPAVAGPTPSTSVQQEVLGLYAALYGRAAEFPGYSYWVGIDGNQSDSDGVTLANASNTAVTFNDAQVLGQGFVNTQNTYFNQVYGSLSDSNFINAMYVNIGGNSGDPGGIAYWANLLQQAEGANPTAAQIQVARAGLVGQFVHDLIDVNLAAFTGLTPAQLLAAEQRQETINNKIAVSLVYSNLSQAPGGSILVPHVVGDAAFQAATTVLQSVTYDPNTASVAITGIEQAVAQNNLHLI
jgi:phospholipase/lecithinase/hemolysin